MAEQLAIDELRAMRARSWDEDKSRLLAEINRLRMLSADLMEDVMAERALRREAERSAAAFERRLRAWRSGFDAIVTRAERAEYELAILRERNGTPVRQESPNRSTVTRGSA